MNNFAPEPDWQGLVEDYYRSHESVRQWQMADYLISFDEDESEVCHMCKGNGEIVIGSTDTGTSWIDEIDVCFLCKGSGRVEHGM